MCALLFLALLAQVTPTPPPRPAAAGTVAEARLEGDTFAVDLYVDLDALLLGLSPAAPAAQRLTAMEMLRAGGKDVLAAMTERLTEYLRRRVRVRFDGVAADLKVEFPERRMTEAGDLTTLGSFARLRARVPAAAREVTFFASRSFRFIDLRVAIGDRRSRQMVEPGAESAPIALR